MRNPFAPAPKTPPAPQESQITLGSGMIEVAFNHTTKTVFILDQSGTGDVEALQDLLAWYRNQGWFLHAVTVMPPTIIDHGGEP